VSKGNALIAAKSLFQMTIAVFKHIVLGNAVLTLRESLKFVPSAAKPFKYRDATPTGTLSVLEDVGTFMLSMLVVCVVENCSG
jgi:hypothetical protein